MEWEGGGRIRVSLYAVLHYFDQEHFTRLCMNAKQIQIGCPVGVPERARYA